ncbi:MAG: ABC transporter permease [Pseudomonadota bacterium]
MSFGEAFGFVLGGALIVWSVWYYFQPTANPETGVPNAGVTFFRWAVQGLIFFFVISYLFREFGRLIGTDGTRKLFRQMPLTAAFGILTIIAYAFLAIFAGQISVQVVVGVGLFGIVLIILVRRSSGDQTATSFAGVMIAIFAVFVGMYFYGPIAPYGQAEILGSANVVAGGDPALNGDPAYPLGTDQIGRDILSRLIYGAQNTVGIAFVTTVLAFVIGATLGFLAATLQGWLDQLLSRAVDVLMAIPSLIFALLLMTIASVWANELGIPLTIFMVVIIAVIDSTRVYRLARAVGLNIVVMDYIEAAKLRGEGLGYLVFKEILPNATAPLLAEFGLRFCFVFLTIAALSFLGVGIQPPLADWGTMVRDLAPFINFAAFAPSAATAPLLAAGAIALLTVAVNFVVDWMLHRSSGLKD